MDPIPMSVNRNPDPQHCSTLPRRYKRNISPFNVHRIYISVQYSLYFLLRSRACIPQHCLSPSLLYETIFTPLFKVRWTWPKISYLTKVDTWIQILFLYTGSATLLITLPPLYKNLYFWNIAHWTWAKQQSYLAKVGTFYLDPDP